MNALAATISTQLGVFRVSYSARGLSGVDFPGQSHANVPSGGSPSEEEWRHWHALTTQALALILSGKPPHKLPPLDLESGSAFQKSVWEALLNIPPGATKTYGDIAADLGIPAGARAVGAACGANPLPLIVPCHRVVATNGRLGGFSGGIEWKRHLLRIEGVLLT